MRRKEITRERKFLLENCVERFSFERHFIVVLDEIYKGMANLWLIENI